jgi:hypothetical protein
MLNGSFILNFQGLIAWQAPKWTIKARSGISWSIRWNSCWCASAFLRLSRPRGWPYAARQTCRQVPQLTKTVCPQRLSGTDVPSWDCRHAAAIRRSARVDPALPENGNALWPLGEHFISRPSSPWHYAIIGHSGGLGTEEQWFCHRQATVAGHSRLHRLKGKLDHFRFRKPSQN